MVRSLSLHGLYAAAGAQFAFDARTLRFAIALIEGKIDELQTRYTVSP